MEIILVGADFEENLGLGMIAAAADAAGHHVEVLPFNDPWDAARVAEAIIVEDPDVVGLGIQFQHRSHEFLDLGRRLRAGGFGGHITCGGQFPTLAWREVLRFAGGVDSIVLHEGERTFVELLDALRWDRPLVDVPGLALVGPSGAPRRTAGRPLEPALDELSFPRRYRPHHQHMGVPFIPILGSRGCWGRCSFCSITSFYRDAKRHGGGKLLRLRSPENIAAEMALLWHAAGKRGVFCFHDENFLLPRPKDSLARLQAIRGALDSLGVGQVGLIGKCRPDTLTPELARELRALGVIRLYVGVENASSSGAEHLGRARITPHLQRALAACEEAGIFCCYNLLLFEPGATLDDVEENIAFIRQHAGHPVNFCRAEPYCGTPLQLDLAQDDALGGSYLGYDYRVRDDRAELLFRICAAAFRQRNFAQAGVHNRYMGLGYNAKLLEYFHEDGGRRDELLRDADALTRTIALETADLLEAALRLARNVDLSDRERIERETALLGLRIAEADRIQHVKLDQVYVAMNEVAEETGQPLRPPTTAGLRRVIQRVAQSVAVGGWLTIWAAGVQGCDCGSVDDPVPSDYGLDDGSDLGIADPPPPDKGMDTMVVDMMPPDKGIKDGMIADPLPPDMGVKDGMIADPPPPDMGVKHDGMIADPPPPDKGVKPPPDASIADPLPSDASVDASGVNRPRSPIDQCRDTSPRRAVRSSDLPLFAPPVVALSADRDEDGVRVKLSSDTDAISTRWESDGKIDGQGREVRWFPDSSADQIRVAVRSEGGVAVVALHARDVA